MALIAINPVEARVRWDRRAGRPLTVAWADRSLVIRGLEAVRSELAAYPAGRGPRITFVVRTDAGNAALVYDGRRHRWFVEAVDQAA